jgi:plastocyanin
VYLALLHPRDELSPAILEGSHLDTRMGAAVCREDVRHSGLHELRRRPDSQDAAGAAPEHGAPRPERLGLGQDVAGPRGDLLAVRGGDDAATDAVEEPHAEIPLQIADLTRQRGLADVQTAGGQGHAARVDDADEIAEMAELHRAKCPGGIDHSRSFDWTEQLAVAYKSGMQRLVWAFLAGGVLAPAIVGAEDLRIEMRAVAYTPAEVRGRVGDTVTLVNHDSVLHQPFVPTTGWGVNVGDVKPGSTAGFPVARPGQFEIECAYHPGMRATVVVER